MTMDMTPVTWSDYSGEFGDTAYPIRRVRYAGGARGIAKHIRVEYLFRVEWYNPSDSGTMWEWESAWTYAL